MGKRNRACEECHRLKIKCDASTASAGACERCIRSNLECVPATPRLQRDRINELEAQIQHLRNVLRDQSSSTSSATPGRSPSHVGSLLSSLEDRSHAVLSFLDARVSPIHQKDVLRSVALQATAVWPVICLPFHEGVHQLQDVRLSEVLDHFRSKCPMLLLTMVAYAVTQDIQGTDADVHDELVQEAMRLLGDEILARGNRSLELVQALLIATFWNKVTRKGQQGSCYQLVQIAVDMAIDLGIAGPALQPSPVAYFSRHDDTTSLEARRTWLACYIALTNSSISIRRAATVPWNAYHQECLMYVETLGEPSDILLGQLVRITQLIHRASERLSLCQLDTFVDGNDYSTYATIQTLKDELDMWAAQVPPSLASSQTLKVFGHVAMIHIHEVALHTPTNKASFAAPFIPGRIAVNDFPKPINIIPPLKIALECIVQNCHAVIDTAVEMDPALILGLPTFGFAPTVLYSLFMLVTMLVAASDPMNTYGQFIGKDDLRVEECGRKLRELTAAIRQLDPTMSCYTTRMFDATSWLQQWYNDYSAILERYETNASRF